MTNIDSKLLLELQEESLSTFMSMLNFVPVQEGKLCRGFIKHKCQSYYYGANFISFEDACRLHNSKDHYDKNNKDIVDFVESVGFTEDIFHIQYLYPDIRSKIMNDLYYAHGVKLFETVKLQRNKNIKHGIQIQTNNVKITPVGECYL